MKSGIIKQLLVYLQNKLSIWLDIFFINYIYYTKDHFFKIKFETLFFKDFFIEEYKNFNNQFLIIKFMATLIKKLYILIYNDTFKLIWREFLILKVFIIFYFLISSSFHIVICLFLILHLKDISYKIFNDYIHEYKKKNLLLILQFFLLIYIYILLIFIFI